MVGRCTASTQGLTSDSYSSTQKQYTFLRGRRLHGHESISDVWWSWEKTSFCVCLDVYPWYFQAYNLTFICFRDKKVWQHPTITRRKTGLWYAQSSLLVSFRDVLHPYALKIWVQPDLHVRDMLSSQSSITRREEVPMRTTTWDRRLLLCQYIGRGTKRLWWTASGRVSSLPNQAHI